MHGSQEIVATVLELLTARRTQYANQFGCILRIEALREYEPNQ
jgi:hypothetical protein